MKAFPWMGRLSVTPKHVNGSVNISFKRGVARVRHRLCTSDLSTLYDEIPAHMLRMLHGHCDKAPDLHVVRTGNITSRCPVILPHASSPLPLLFSANTIWFVGGMTSRVQSGTTKEVPPST